MKKNVATKPRGELCSMCLDRDRRNAIGKRRCGYDCGRSSRNRSFRLRVRDLGRRFYVPGTLACAQCARSTDSAPRRRH